MLHYKILSYGSDCDWEIMVDLISLRDAGEIEKQFIRRLNDYELDDPFNDELSARLLEELDGSRRVGEYAVLTPKGKGCITCLSTAVKFGLMVIETAKQGRPVITKPYASGIPVLEWLSRNGEYDLVLTDNECDRSLKEVLTLVNNGAADLQYMGLTYSSYGMKDCMAAIYPLVEKNENAQSEDY